MEEIVFNNIERLNFVSLTFSEAVAHDSRYQEIFETVKKDFTARVNNKIDMKKGILSITDFGQRFIDICIK